MTRKDYIAIAGALRQTYGDYLRIHGEEGEDAVECLAIGQAAIDIAGVLGHANPHFDREHFLAVVRGERDLNSRPPKR